jgi:hypothetical protein
MNLFGTFRYSILEYNSPSYNQFMFNQTFPSELESLYSLEFVYSPVFEKLVETTFQKLDASVLK